MEIEYGSNRLKKQLSNASEIKKAFGTMAVNISRRIAQITASPNLYVLMQLPAGNCHPLKEDRKGEWAISVTGNFRMIFTIANDPIVYKADHSVDTMKVTVIKIVSIEDYH